MPSNRTFSDIDFNLQLHPASKDVLKVYDLESVKQSVKHLVMTEFYGRPFHPEIGSSVSGLLFDNWSPTVAQAIERTITDVIKGNEPRAEVSAVRAEFDDSNSIVRAEVDVYLYALMQAATIDIILKRVR